MSFKPTATAHSKLRNNLQQQLLSNYYLHQYDTMMSKLTDHPNFSSLQQHQQNQTKLSISSHENTNTKERKNFKEEIMKKRKEGESGRINFKMELTEKKKEQTEFKENLRVFHKLEKTLRSEISQASPSKLETGGYHTIHVKNYQSPQNKTRKYEVKSISPQKAPNIEIYNQISDDDDSLFGAKNNHSNKKQRKIEITRQKERNAHEQEDKEREREIEREKAFVEKYMEEQKRRVMAGIEQTFQERKSSPSKSKLSSKKVIQRQDDEQIDRQEPIRKVSLSPARYSSLNNKSSPRKSPIQSKNTSKAILPSNEFQIQTILSPPLPIVYFQKDPDPQPQHEQLQSQRVVEEDPITIMPQSSPLVEFLPATGNIEYKSPNQNLVEESFRYVEEGKDYEEKTYGQARARDYSSHHEQTNLHQLSGFSKFSITSEECSLIRNTLNSELSNLGPYQSALSSLSFLLDEFPTATPILTVAQRILEDRKIYENKREVQNQELKKLKNGITKWKKQKKLSEEEKNIREIMRLTRRIAEQ